jgi:DinB superfamily
VSQVVRTRQELLESLDQLDKDFVALLQNFSPEQLNWVPALGVWSIAQCIDHVARTNTIYIPVIQARISRATPRADFAGNPLRTAGWPSTLFLRSVSPEGARKNRAPESARPAGASSINSAEALQILLETHVKIRSILNASAQPDLNRIRFRNPFIPLLHFTVATGILVMVGHAQRHLQQALRIAKSAGFPQSGISKSA